MHTLETPTSLAMTEFVYLAHGETYNFTSRV